MDICDNVFCAGEIIDFEYVSVAGRSFCCIACADDWNRQNEALEEAADPFRDHGEPVRGQISARAMIVSMLPDKLDVPQSLAARYMGAIKQLVSRVEQ